MTELPIALYKSVSLFSATNSDAVRFFSPLHAIVPVNSTVRLEDDFAGPQNSDEQR